MQVEFRILFHGRPAKVIGNADAKSGGFVPERIEFIDAEGGQYPPAPPGGGRTVHPSPTGCMAVPDSALPPWRDLKGRADLVDAFRSVIKPAEWLMLLSLFLWPAFGALSGYAYGARDIGLLVFAVILTVVLPVFVAWTLKSGVLRIKRLVVKRYSPRWSASRRSAEGSWTPKATLIAWVLSVLVLAVVGSPAGVIYQRRDYVGAGVAMLLLGWGIPLYFFGGFVHYVVKHVSERRNWRKDDDPRKKPRRLFLSIEEYDPATPEGQMLKRVGFQGWFRGRRATFFANTSAIKEVSPMNSIPKSVVTTGVVMPERIDLWDSESKRPDSVTDAEWEEIRTWFLDAGSTEIRVPQLPESVADATLVTWHKQPGDVVRRDENVADLETDNAVLEVSAPASGVFREIRVQSGAVVRSGQVLAAMLADELWVAPKAPRRRAVSH